MVLILSADDSVFPALHNLSLSEMSFLNDGATWSAWQTYAASAFWTLEPGDGAKTVYARFRDQAGNVSEPVSADISLDTAAGGQYGVSINEGTLFTNQVDVILTLGALPGVARMMVSNDGGFSGMQWEPYHSRRPWTITQYGSYVIPRTVYVRFGDANGNVLDQKSDDIILDVNPPTGSVSFEPTGAGGEGVQNQQASELSLILSAEDDVSGVGFMRISGDPTFSGAAWLSYASRYTWLEAGGQVVYVQYRDYAGNISEVYSAAQTHAWRQFLPFVQ